MAVAGIVAKGLALDLIPAVSDESAGATAEIQPSSSFVHWHGIEDDPCNAAPLILPDGCIGVGQFKLIVDPGIGTFPGIIVVSVEGAEVLMRVSNERKMAGFAPAELQVGADV